MSFAERLDEVNVRGRRVGGRYQLEALLGQGGMGQVWRAIDTTLERPVALKLLKATDDLQQDELDERFLREARLAASAQHPNVVSVLDFGTDTDGRPFMVMEILEGESLENRLARGPALTVAELAPLVAQTLEGLARVHDLGIVHRDLKPANVFLARLQNGTICPKLLDFGISCAESDFPERCFAPNATRPGYLVGTPQYMSPEQARNESRIDHRTDIFSFGVVLYEALTGRLPFSGKHVPEILILIDIKEATPVYQIVPETRGAISAVVARAMEKDPDTRWQSAAAMRDAWLAATASAKRLSLPPAAAHLVTSSIAETLDPAREFAPTLPSDLTSLAPPSGKEPIRLPAAHWRPWLVAAAAVAAGMLMTVGVRALMLSPRAEVARTVTTVPERPPAPSAAVMMATHAPRKSSTARAIVRLLRVPAGGTVVVDGRPVTGRAPAIALDGADHSIEVWLAGSPVWSTTHRATAGGTYVIARAPSATRTSRRSERTAMAERDQVSRSRDRASSRRASRPPTARLVRTLDY